MDHPWSTIAESEDGSVAYQLHVPTPDGYEMVYVLPEGPARELYVQLEEFLTLVEQKKAVEAIIAQDAGGH